MKRVAFLTCASEANLCEDDRSLVPMFRARGVEVVPCIWDGPDVVDLDAMDLVVVRSCWDYHEKTAELCALIDSFRGRRAPLVNPPEVVSWNLDKVYLRDLEKRGARLPRSLWLEVGTATTLAEAADLLGTDDVVVKPRVSLSAVDTFRLSGTSGESAARFRALADRKALIVQEFVPEIVHGECSLMFFDGAFSHAVRKVPARGDFRVQADHGGTREVIVAPGPWIAEATELLGELPAMTYARVDVVATPRGLVWMELEAIDPMLFFAYEPDASERFFTAVMARSGR